MAGDDAASQRQITKEEFFDLYFRHSGAEAAGAGREEYRRNFFDAEEKPGMTYWANEPRKSGKVTVRIEPAEREIHLFLESVSHAAPDAASAPHVSYGVPEPDDDPATDAECVAEWNADETVSVRRKDNY